MHTSAAEMLPKWGNPQGGDSRGYEGTWLGYLQFCRNPFYFQHIFQQTNPTPETSASLVLFKTQATSWFLVNVLGIVAALVGNVAGGSERQTQGGL